MDKIVETGFKPVSIIKTRFQIMCLKTGFYFNECNYYLINGAITRATTAMSFINMLRDGPEVSLKGSPTVSPITDAL